jgi:hypothetical protein
MKSQGLDIKRHITSPNVENSTKKMKWPSAKTNRGNTKEILQTKSGTLGELGNPPWWFFRVNFFIRFLDASPPNKNSQTNGFSPKFPTFFFYVKKTK